MKLTADLMGFARRFVIALAGILGIAISSSADLPTQILPDAGRDAFGIRRLFPTRTGGREWFAKWTGTARSFNGVDPNDPWFDADHGEGRYEVDGRGKLTATGPIVRMYVHDPARQVEWSENLEITVYFKRIRETRQPSYSGLQILAHTDHGATGDENRNLCDDRGYGAKVTVDGRCEFEKEIAHHRDNGSDSVATVRPWKELPKNVSVGVKFVLRNVAHDTQVKLELYRDLADGKNGGTWEKVTGFTDTGRNFGVGKTPPAVRVKPELALIRRMVLPDSENKTPMMSVYLRHEYGTMEYERFSIREIDPGEE
jgi:hypothetical protein